MVDISKCTDVADIRRAMDYEILQQRIDRLCIDIGDLELYMYRAEHRLKEYKRQKKILDEKIEQYNGAPWIMDAVSNE